MTQDRELAACPFCGDASRLLVEHLEGTILHPAYRVRCDNCGASTEYTDKDYASSWNRRTPAVEDVRDAERLDWLIEQHATLFTDGAGLWQVAFEYTAPETTYGPMAASSRAAIDAAMEKERAKP